MVVEERQLQPLGSDETGVVVRPLLVFQEEVGEEVEQLEHRLLAFPAEEEAGEVRPLMDVQVAEAAVVQQELQLTVVQEEVVVLPLLVCLAVEVHLLMAVLGQLHLAEEEAHVEGQDEMIHQQEAVEEVVLLERRMEAQGVRLHRVEKEALQEKYSEQELLRR